MTDPGLPAVAGGTPLRSQPLPYGRHQLSESDVAAVVESLRSGTLTGGPGVAAFERALADRCGAAHAVAVSNGTAALDLAVAALGIGPGDEVITTPLTFVSTANAVVRAGATPVFADVGADRCLDPRATAAAVTARTRAVITVDYSGLPADVDALRAALPRPLPVIADAAHSLGASLGGRAVGSLADVTTFSFHPVKQITTGEGGAVLTSDGAAADRVRHLRNHGMTSTAEERSGAQWRYDVTTLGSNHRLTAFQAALGTAQLGRLEDIVAQRSELAARYDALLGRIPGIGLPPRPDGRRSAWHLYAIEIDAGVFGCNRDAVIDALRAEGIEATLHYPAVHLLALYRSRGGRSGTAPRAEALCGSLVTLPLFPSMTPADQEDVVTALTRIQAWAGAHPVGR
ncbi:MAG: DegT/DnrJ/EryC1/StrS family aminotransferase [Candidatus Dormibacteraeota bacterium]|uniref:DegT/DnrJ/EryC1/StrS family aminotransferase n=1 Tax=Candidatus Aeolococcus gillhamiae TaxID=3127015 RepID=A0A2W6AA64_9BACT|nr:DegT/DnrJ/EryC1/StrS family aminotransferase [Candidatus Dormibacteraeota bacterium]PZR80404.1 MAG: UDP-4-amino-4,6-dideoxy-N-acetyl-beta-L-altrosamine transaminase [Candidatus Dormibacter sp. RRmetagenome_bin12]